MISTRIEQQHFETLRQKFGTHSEVARRLGVGPSHYRYVRRTGRMSEPLANLILYLAKKDAA